MIDHAENELEREYGLAGFLLISNGDDRLSNRQVEWTAPGHWWPGYEIDLGAAHGPRHEWKQLLRRDFEFGMVLFKPAGVPHEDGPPARPVLDPRRSDRG